MTVTAFFSATGGVTLVEGGVAQPLKTAEMTRANTGMVYFIIEILNKINKPVVALRRYYVVPA